MSVYEGLSESQQFACRVIADHARATAFAIADGIVPGNEGRNYVLRKIMRRAIYHGREHLGKKELFFYKVCDEVVDRMRSAFPELETHREFIGKMVRLEEERFGNTVTVGLSKLNELDLKSLLVDENQLFSEIARLYDTYGTPRDLIRVFLEENGKVFEEDEFNERFDASLQALQQQSGIGKTERKSEISPVYAKLLDQTGANDFHGYETTQIEDAKVVAIFDGDKQVNELKSGETGSVVLNKTPFYAESGGQVGDVGKLAASDFAAKVSDTYSPVPGLIIHKATIEDGSLKLGDEIVATVDIE
ncbi:MAG: alanine--tRNA ligase-related protein, partial [Pyrinomonadaceae bacterium]